MTNTNCLHGKRCPQCKQEEAIEVVATHWVKVTDDGTDWSDIDHDEEYGDEALAICPDCKFEGTWLDFDKTRRKVSTTTPAPSDAPCIIDGCPLTSTVALLRPDATGQLIECQYCQTHATARLVAEKI